MSNQNQTPVSVVTSIMDWIKDWVCEVFVDKANRKYSIRFAALPEASQKRIISYGLSQLLGDAAASVQTTTKVGNNRVPLKGADLAKAYVAAQALIDQRMSDLSAGILRRVRESSIDPVEAEARKLAISLVKGSADFKAFLSSKGWNATDKGAVDELAKRAAVKAREAKIIAIARRRVDELADLEA